MPIALVESITLSATTTKVDITNLPTCKNILLKMRLRTVNSDIRGYCVIKFDNSTVNARYLGQTHTFGLSTGAVTQPINTTAANCATGAFSYSEVLVSSPQDSNVSYRVDSCNVEEWSQGTEVQNQMAHGGGSGNGPYSTLTIDPASDFAANCRIDVYAIT